MHTFSKQVFKIIIVNQYVTHNLYLYFCFAMFHHLFRIIINTLILSKVYKINLYLH